MIEMDLDQAKSDAERRWSPVTSPRGAWKRDKSRTYGSKHGPEVWDNWSRRGMDRSASPGCLAAEKHRRGSESMCLPVKHELEEGEKLKECKRGRYLDHSKENFTESLERRHYSYERLPRGNGTDSTGGEKHKLFRYSKSSCAFLKRRCQRDSAFKYASRAASFNGGRLMKDELRERIHHRRDSDEPFGLSEAHRGTSVPGKYFGEGQCQHGEDYSSCPQCMLHERLDLSSCDHKRGFDAGCDNGLSRHSPRSCNRATTNEAHISSKWRSNYDRWGYHMECDNYLKETTSKDAPNSTTQKSENVSWVHNTKTDNSLSWNGPKWGEEITSEDAPTFSKWRSGDVNHAGNEDTDISLQWNGSKWGEEVNTKCAANSSQWKLVADNPGPNVDTANNLSCTDLKWVDEKTVKDAPSVWRSSTTNEWDSWETNNGSSWNGPKWDDRPTTKVAASSSHWRSDVNKWGSNVKTDNTSSWNGSKWGDETTTKNAPYSSQRQRNADRQVSNVETDNSLAWKGPKWSDRTTTKCMPNTSRCRLDNDKLANNMESRKRSWKAPNWDDQRTTKDAPKSSRCRPDGDNWDYNVKISNRFSLDSPKWGDQTNTKHQSDVERKQHDSRFSKHGAKWGDQTFTKGAAKSSQWRSNAVQQGYSMETDNISSWNGPKFDKKTMEATHVPFTRKSEDAKNNPYEVTKNSSPWNGPKWGDETTAKGATSSHGRLDVDNVEANKGVSWDGPEWGDQRATNVDTLHSSGCRADDEKQGYNMEAEKTSWNDVKWSNQKTTKDAPKNSQQMSDDYKRDNTVKTGNSFPLDAPKLDDQLTTEVSPKFSQQSSDNRKDHYLKIDNSLLQHGSNWGDQTITMDAPRSDQWRPDAGKKVYSVEIDNSSLFHGPKWADQATADASKCPRWRPDSDKEAYNLETDGKLSQSVNDAPTSSHQRSYSAGSRASTTHSMGTGDTMHKTCSSLENPEQNTSQEATTRASPTHEQNVMQEGSGKDQNIPKFSQSPSSKLSEQNGQDKQNLNIDERNEVPLPYEAQNQQMAHSVSMNWQDAMTDAPTNGHGLELNWHRHQVRNNEQLSQLSATLKPFNNEASAATALPIQPSLRPRSSEPITSDSYHLKHSNVVMGSRTSSKFLAPSSSTSAPSSDGDTNCSTNVEGKLHHGNQGPKQAELIGGGVMEVNETQTGQCKKEQNTSHPNVADCDTRKADEVNKEDEKGIRMFKFAIVEFVKDILKPSWKEGHLSKEAHKIIVKKVVDKVVGTVQSTDTLRTQRNIDLYMSYSKIKLTKLVQAYLERYAKI